MPASLSATPTARPGTIAMTAGSTAVTGTGTNFAAGDVGNILIAGSFNARIAAVASATSITLADAPEQGWSGACSTVGGGTLLQVTGANTSIATSGIPGIAGVSSRVVGGQTIYRLGAYRLNVAGGANSLTYNAVNEALAWNTSTNFPEMTIDGTLTVTGSKTNGTLTRNVYPTAFYINRKAATVWSPADTWVSGAGAKNWTGITVSIDGVTDNVAMTLVDCKVIARTQNSNFRMSTATSVNGLEADNINIVMPGIPIRLDGVAQYAASSAQWVSLPATTATTPRTYVNWSVFGGAPRFESYGNLTYIEMQNYGDFAGSVLYANHANGFYIRFSRNLTFAYKTVAGGNVPAFVAYCPDNNNGNRAAPYTANEPMIVSGSAGAATGNRLLAIHRQNSVGQGSTVDLRNPGNNTSGDDVLFMFAYGYLPVRVPVNLKGNNALAISLTATADVNVTLSEAAARAKLASSFTVDPVGKTVTVTANSTFDDVYDAMVAYKATATEANLQAPTTADLTQYIVTASGANLTAFTGWTLVVNTGITLSSGAKFTYLKFDTVTINGTGQITGVYGTSSGDSSTLELRDVSNGSAYCVYNAATGATIAYGVNNTGSNQTYRVYFAPGSAGTQIGIVKEKYGFQRNEEVVALQPGLSFLVATDVEDVGISQKTQATVAAYTTLETPDKLYDYTALFRLSEAGIKLGQITTRDGTSLKISAPYSVKVNQNASAVYAISGNTITIKSTSFANGSKYTTTVLTPPAALTATTNEAITADLEDANGDSSVKINAASNSTFELWKITNATPPDNYATGTNLGTSAVGKYRFMSAPGFKMVIRDATTNYRVVVSMDKGIYTADLFFGSAVQLAQAALVEVINNKVDVLTTDIAAIKGSGFTSTTDSLKAASTDLAIINRNVQKASLLIPATEQLP